MSDKLTKDTIILDFANLKERITKSVEEYNFGDHGGEKLAKIQLFDESGQQFAVASIPTVDGKITVMQRDEFIARVLADVSIKDFDGNKKIIQSEIQPLAQNGAIVSFQAENAKAIIDSTKEVMQQNGASAEQLKKLEALLNQASKDGVLMQAERDGIQDYTKSIGATLQIAPDAVPYVPPQALNNNRESSSGKAI